MKTRITKEMLKNFINDSARSIMEQHGKALRASEYPRGEWEIAIEGVSFISGVPTGAVPYVIIAMINGATRNAERQANAED